MSHIFENIYLGSLEDAQDEKFIKANNIKIIIWLSDEQEKSFHSNNINFFNFKVEDVIFESNKLFNLCRVIYKILDNNTDNIFIHCTQGVSRSPTVVLYYLMRKYNLKFQEALKFVKDKRNIVNPNIGFQNILKKYENDIATNIILEEKSFMDRYYDDLFNNKNDYNENNNYI